jgi:hypothetical protein
MRNQIILVVCLLMLSFSSLSQSKSQSKAKSAAQPSQTSTLPSEEDVNAFLHATFGYDPQLTWKIVSIKPSEAEGLAEVFCQRGPQTRCSRRSHSFRETTF